MAIRMIPQYFPNNVEFTDEDNVAIAEAFFSHVQNAATRGDSGYAYNGINNIINYINRLPETIVMKVLGKYGFYYIINNKVYRNQIYTIINYMDTKKSKEEYMFFFIDSVLIINMFRRLFFHYEKKDWNGFDWDIHSNIEPNIKILRNIEYEEVYNLTYNLFNSRKIIFSDKILFNIEYKEGSIIIQYNQKMIRIELDINDWILNSYESNEFFNNFKSLFSSNTISNDTNLSNNGFTFSSVYLNNYRGLKQKCLSFDKRYIYDYQNREIKPNDTTKASTSLRGKYIFIFVILYSG